MRPWTRWQDWLSVVFGAWLFVAPWVLGMIGDSMVASWNSWILGVAVAAVALGSLRFPDLHYTEWISVAFGAWLFVSPWILGFAGLTVAWNFWIFGVLIAAAAGLVLVEMMRGSHTAASA